MTAGVLMIGDEILSGAVHETNLREIAQVFARHGVEIAEARIVVDEVGPIVRALNALRAENHYVVTTGGLGPTHDDVTVDALAAAFGVALHENPEIIDIMERFWEAEVTPAKRRMARTPAGAQLIHGHRMTLPGIAFENVFVLAGVPSVVTAMLQDVGWRLEGGPVTLTRAIAAEGLAEDIIAEPLERVARAHPTMSFGSYPCVGRYGAKLVVRGRDLAEIEAALDELSAALIQAGVPVVRPLP